MHEALNSLAESLSKFVAFDSEKASLDAAEKKAQADLKAATTEGPIDSPNVARKVSSASTMLDTIAGRRAHIQSQAAGLVAELEQKLRAADAAWMGCLTSRADAIKAKWIKVNAQFFPDGEEGAASATKLIHLPGVDDIHLFTWKPLYRITPENAVATVAHFVRHIKKHGPALNLIVTLSPNAPKK